MKKLSRKTILPTGPALAAAALAACLALCSFIGHAGAQTAGRVEYQELSWSPDGKKISFTANRDKNWDIYVMNADGSNLVRLTDDPAGDLYASWSPDGRSLAFASKREGKYAIYVTGADGKNPRRVIATADNTYPSWSPDGRSLAFMSNRTGKWQIYVAKADGSGERRVTSSQGNDYNPAWSPDGKKLAFESDRDGGDIDEIYVVDASGKNERRITKNNEKKVNDVFPTWISKKRISYTTVANRRVDVQVMTSDGLNPTLLIEHAFFARWSPDRSKIAFISQATGESPSQIYLMSADGKSRTQLTR